MVVLLASRPMGGAPTMKRLTSWRALMVATLLLWAVQASQARPQ